MAIPRLIHQTVHNKEWTLNHPVLRGASDKLINLNPGWRYRLYDDDDARAFIYRTYGARMLRAFERINPAYGPARADLFRYLLLYEEGGVYLDIKSIASKSFSEVLKEDDSYLLSHWRNEPGESHVGWGLYDGCCGPRGEFQQWFIVAAPRHPFLKAVIERVVDNIETCIGAAGQFGVLSVTGPIPYTLAILPLLNECPHRLVDIATLGFDYCIFKSNADWQPPGRKHYSTLSEPVIRDA